MKHCRSAADRAWIIAGGRCAPDTQVANEKARREAGFEYTVTILLTRDEFLFSNHHADNQGCTNANHPPIANNKTLKR